MRSLWDDFNFYEHLQQWTDMMSILRVANGPPQHRNGGQRARRQWKRRRASGVRP